MNVTATDFVTVPTQDFEASRRFYGETLGLAFGKQWGKMPAAEYETGNLTIAIMQMDAFGQEFRVSGGMIALQVEDVEATRSELEGKGIEFKGDTIDSGVCHMAIFADPEGNPLMLHHRYAPPA